MVVLVTCKNDEDPSKNKGTRVLTTFLPLLAHGEFSRHSRADNSTVPGWSLLNFKMVFLVTCKNEEDPIKKMKALEWSQDFPHYNPM